MPSLSWIYHISIEIDSDVGSGGGSFSEPNFVV